MLELTDICKAFEKNTVNEKVALDQVSFFSNALQISVNSSIEGLSFPVVFSFSQPAFYLG
ncbi:MAG TPA: hypothetical protein GX520_07880, partial [Syntrophaceticus sp.]|nr:hypothetical protein [Syntrophaceticus sp.]